MIDFTSISTYTRAQAIDDGVLVDVTKQAGKTGILLPTAMTYAAWTRATGELEGFDLTIRLMNVMLQAAEAMRANRQADRIMFTTAAPEVDLYVTIGPGDNYEPVLTIMLEGED